MLTSLVKQSWLSLMKQLPFRYLLSKISWDLTLFFFLQLSMGENEKGGSQWMGLDDDNYCNNNIDNN